MTTLVHILRPRLSTFFVTLVHILRMFFEQRHHNIGFCEISLHFSKILWKYN